MRGLGRTKDVKVSAKSMLAFVLCVALVLETADIRVWAAGAADSAEAITEISLEEPGDVSGNETKDALVGTEDGEDPVALADDVQAVNADGLIASGEQYGIKWSIDGNGVLILSGDAEQISRYNAATGEPAWLEHNASITSVIVTVRNVEYTDGWFWNCYNLKTVDMSQFNTDNVKDVSSMFNGCRSLTELDLSNFDTSHVTSMSFMFDGCDSMTNLDISSFDTSRVTDMTRMFGCCKSLTELDLSNFNTSQVTDMHLMFYECEKLTNLDLSNFNTSRVEDMSRMFSTCRALTSLNIQACRKD